jgi:hypothetical protein
MHIVIFAALSVPGWHSGDQPQGWGPDRLPDPAPLLSSCRPPGFLVESREDELR